MNRTDRLYGLVEELRAVAPRPRSARWLSARFEVSVRTVERDISALQQTGVPVYAETGRTGGYCLDKTRTLPPVNFTPDEAVAMAVGLQRLAGTPFHQAAATALRKLIGAMSAEDAARARTLAARVWLEGAPPAAPMPRVMADALSARRVLRIRYADKTGTASLRDVEPMLIVGRDAAWYLVAWCRLRHSVRVFRTDRIEEAGTTTEVTEPRDPTGLHLPGRPLEV